MPTFGPRLTVLALVLSLLVPVVGLRAEDPPAAAEPAAPEVTWPTVGELTAKATAGEFLQYAYSDSGAKDPSPITMWVLYGGTADGKADFSVIQTNRRDAPWQPITESAADVKVQKRPMSVAAPFMDVPIPRQFTVTSGSLNATPVKDQEFAGRGFGDEVRADVVSDDAG